MLSSQVKNEVLQKIRQLAGDSTFDEKVKKDEEALKEVLEQFPFRQNPSLIDRLTPEKLYSPGGSRDSFFYFFEFKLKRVGHIRVFSNKAWREACEKIELFKNLLKLIVNDKEPIHKKIDDKRWLELKGWGGDRHYVKKLVFIYYHDRILPTFKTEMLEMWISGLGLFEEAKRESMRKYNEELHTLTVGKKFELYNELILRSIRKILPESEMEKWNTMAIARLLGQLFPSSTPVVEKPGPLSKIPILYEPVNELGVVLLFGMYHRELGFPYIIKVQRAFPDMIALDEDGNYCRIEFEYRASNFLQHGHDLQKCDYIICWTDDLESGNPIKDKVISLKEEIFERAELDTEEES